MSSPTTIASFPDAYQANSFAGLLNSNGIHARVVGDYTSGFQAEAPGEVQVLVASEQLGRARELLGVWNHEQGDSLVDWSLVDVGDPTEVTEAERAFDELDSADAIAQFSLAALIWFQCGIAIVAAVIASLIRGGVLAYFIGASAVTAIPFACLFGILRITSPDSATLETSKIMFVFWLPGLILFLLLFNPFSPLWH